MTEPKIEDLPNLESPTGKELSFSTVKNWLRKHESSFMAALEVFAEKHELGFQEMSRSEGWEELFKINHIFQISGKDLCGAEVNLLERVYVQL